MIKYDSEFTLDALYDRYQRMIRHPLYRKFCIKYADYFDKDGNENFCLEPTDLLGAKKAYEAWQRDKHTRHEKPNTACQNSSTKIDREKEDLEVEQQRLDEAREAMRAKDELSKKLNVGFMRHFEKPFQRDDMLTAPVFADLNKVLATEPEWSINEPENRGDPTDVSVIHDEHYLRVKINIAPEIPIGQITEEIKSLVRFARSGSRKEQKRNHFKKRQLAYEIWDLRCDRVPYQEIALTLNENLQTVYSKFKMAWKWIIGTDYKATEFRKLLKERLEYKKDFEGLAKLEEKPLKESLAHSELIENTGAEDESWKAQELTSDFVRFCERCKDQECHSIVLAIFTEFHQSGCLPDESLKKFEPCPDFHEEFGYL